VTRTYDDAKCTEPWWLDDAELDRLQDRLFDYFDDADDREPADYDEETAA
jgi:hypothetical protein